MLFAFMILKIAIILIDLLMSIGAIYKMFERLKKLSGFRRGNAVLMDSRFRQDSLASSTTDVKESQEENQNEVRDSSIGSISFGD